MISRRKYPQSLFAQAIIEKLPTRNCNIIDAPCGEGRVGYELSKAIGNEVKGYDWSEKSIKKANRNYRRTNLRYQKKEIHQLVADLEEVDVFCLVNSLFLLPSPEKLLQALNTKMNASSRLFLILPNTESENFKQYQKLEGHVNTNIISPLEYEKYFNGLGFEILSEEGIGNVAFFGRLDVRLFWLFRDEYLYYLEKKNRIDNKSYSILELGIGAK